MRSAVSRCLLFPPCSPHIRDRIRCCCVMLDAGESRSREDCGVLFARAHVERARTRARFCNRDQPALREAQISIALSTDKILPPAALSPPFIPAHRRVLWKCSQRFAERSDSTSWNGKLVNWTFRWLKYQVQFPVALPNRYFARVMTRNLNFNDVWKLECFMVVSVSCDNLCVTLIYFFSETA